MTNYPGWTRNSKGVTRRVRKNDYTEEEKEAVVADFKSHKNNSDREIAERTGLNLNRVSVILTRYFESLKPKI